MSRTIIIKLEASGNRTGPFTITDNYGNVLATDVSKEPLIEGLSFSGISDLVTTIIIQSTGKCKFVKSIPIEYVTLEELTQIVYTPLNTASLWRHLTNITSYNTYYNNIEPYIIEYPFAYQYQDEILQNVKDYTKAYKYISNTDGVFNDNAKIQTNDQYFNKAIVYNGQQCSGVLELLPKPLNNMSAYLQYPKYNTDSKTILYTKSDSFYQYNTFWNVYVNKTEPMFIASCDSLSINKILNQPTMDYGSRSFKKDPMRAKDLLIRHILDNKSDAHLVSQFIVSPSQISYK